MWRAGSSWQEAPRESCQFLRAFPRGSAIPICVLARVARWQTPPIEARFHSNRLRRSARRVFRYPPPERRSTASLPSKSRRRAMQ